MDQCISPKFWGPPMYPTQYDRASDFCKVTTAGDGQFLLSPKSPKSYRWDVGSPNGHSCHFTHSNLIWHGVDLASRTGKGFPVEDKDMLDLELKPDNNNNNNPWTIFIVLSSFMTTKGHCESSLGSFDECTAVHKRPSTLRPSHLTWAVSPPVGSYRLQPPSPFIIITQPES